MSSPATAVKSALPRSALDRSRFFMPERFTPLYYTPIYARLNTAQRRRYNQLHVLYFHEQLAFLEGSLPSTLLVPMLSDARFAELAHELRALIAEEGRHAAMFRALNRRIAPGLYRERDSVFLDAGPLWGGIWRLASSRPALWPTFLWFMLIQEEKALAYTRGFLAQGDLEPTILSVHRRHLADERTHCETDTRLLELAWQHAASALLQLNGHLLAWMLKTFFLAPRRSGWKVVESWLAEHPEVAPERARLRRDLAHLDRNSEYVNMMYGPETIPESWRRMRQRSELTRLWTFLQRRCTPPHTSSASHTMRH